MKLPLAAWLTLSFATITLSCHANPHPDVVELGNDTYEITREAKTGFARDTDKLKEEALHDAGAYCSAHHKELKVISTTAKVPRLPLSGFANAKVVFKALDANDPELHAPVVSTEAGLVHGDAPRMKSGTDTLYSDLMKLDDLRKKGILTDEEFQAQKKKLLEKSN